MNALIQESPAIYIEEATKQVNQVVQCPDLTATMYEFRFTFPIFIATPYAADEMTDQEVLAAAAASGTFLFLDDEGENVYQP